MRAHLTGASSIGIAALLAIASVATARADEARAAPVGVLGAAELTEASGMVASPRREDLLWLVNDSGQSPTLFALGMDGRALGSVRIEGVENRDWEDLAAFTRDGRPFLLIADVGDNDAARAFVVLHAVEEPPVGEEGPPATVAVAWTQRFRFPDGPRDCEAVAVDPRGPTVILLSKRDRPPRLYALPLGPTGEAIAVAEALGTVTGLRSMGTRAYAGQPTALDIARDGRVAVLTYDRVHLFPTGSSVAESLAATPRALALPRVLFQAEALAFARDGGVLVTSEGRRALLVRFEVGPVGDAGGP